MFVYRDADVVAEVVEDGESFISYLLRRESVVNKKGFGSGHLLSIQVSKLLDTFVGFRRILRKTYLHMGGGVFTPPIPKSRCPRMNKKGTHWVSTLFILVSVFADRGEDFRGDPRRKAFGFWLVGSDDDFVEACLIDDIRLA